MTTELETKHELVVSPQQHSVKSSKLRREFLPAALEIVETPASPAGRTLAWTIIAFMSIALAWACFGFVDIISTASGKIVPTGRTKVIQPFETGVVRVIRVSDGQAVKAGAVLIELDPTINTAERDKAAKDLVAAKIDIARLEAAFAGADKPDDTAAKLAAPDGATPAQTALAQAFLIHQLDEFHAKLANLDRQVVQNESNRAAISAVVEKLQGTIPLLKERTEARHYLFDKGAGPKLTYLQDQQDLLEHEQDLKVQRAKLTESEAAIQALKQQRRQANAEFRRVNLNDLTQAQQKASSLQETLTQANQRRDLQTLTAPVDGTVQQLNVHTIGGVVTPAQQLMLIVPADSKLEIEAMVPNRDIGFVREGQDAEIKIDTFNFTRYGLLHGKVLNVSQDAIVREKPNDTKNSDASHSFGGALSNSSEPQGQEYLYSARVSLDTPQMQIEDRRVNLTPGMAVTVEIKTGQRRVIEYLLSPLMRYRQESLRER